MILFRSLFGVYRSVNVFFFVFFIPLNVNRFFTIVSEPRWSINLNLLQVCQFMYMVDSIKCLHCQQLFSQQNLFCNFAWRLTMFSLRCRLVHSGRKGCLHHLRMSQDWRRNFNDRSIIEASGIKKLGRFNRWGLVMWYCLIFSYKVGQLPERDAWGIWTVGV